eukprot:364572_1
MFQIVGGGWHMCAISSLNSVKCFGRNDDGPLGYGDTHNRGDSANEMGNHLPEVDLGTDFSVTRIVSGGYHMCAISILNTVKCWGYNFYGQLGYEDTNNRGDSANEMGNHLPEVYLGTDFHVAQIVVGAYHTCAISVLNTVKCWGYGDTHNR